LLCEETRIAREQYELQKREKAKQKDTDETLLKEPPLKMLFIPTNNSASSMVQTLVENEGAGILFSTEADTLANSLAQDWGNFSDVLRCAFHHEPIDLQRRLNREYLSVADPRLSVLLTGTHGQLLRLIPNTENGLFSRFMYYSFPAVPHFRNVFHRGGADPGNAFKALGEIVLEMYLHLKALEAPLQLYLKEEEGSKFVTLFQNITQVTYKESGTPILGTVHRLGLISFRVAMVLTTFRYFTYPDRKEQLLVKIHPNDFAVAIDLTLNLLYHASILVADMKDGSKQVMKQSKMMALYNKLPEKFNKTEATNIAKSLGISNSTLSRYLVNHHFERMGQGKYRKVSMEQPHEQMTN
jgi:hypothetical protein